MLCYPTTIYCHSDKAFKKNWKKLFQPVKGINNTMKEKKSKTLGERLPETTIADKLFRAAAQRAAREAREKRQK